MKTNSKTKAFLALLLAAAMVLPVLCGAFVRAAAAEESPQVLVTAGTEDGNKLLEEAGAVYDLYLLAPMAAEGHYEFPDGLRPAAWPNGPDAWNALAQDAAAKLVEIEPPDVSGAPLGQWVRKNAESGGEDLEAGLYLLVVRPSEGGGYLKRFENEDGEAYLASELKAKEYAITVAPEIISLPTKEADEEGVINTANPGPWIFSVEVFLKPEFEKRLGSIEIIKDLLTYETSHNAFFVFQVEGMLDGENVYSNLISMRFDGYGEKRQLIENIPVGAEVTVTEIYSTPGYSIVGSDSGKITVAADEVLSVRFENDYDESRDKGDGVMNNFSYDIERGEWSWTQE